MQPNNIIEPQLAEIAPTDPEKGHIDSQAKQNPPGDGCQSTAEQSVYAGLGWLDRLLALWILLPIIV